MALHIAEKSYETEEIQEILIAEFGIGNRFAPADAKAFLHRHLKASDSEKDAWEITKAVEYAVSKKQKVNVIRVGYGIYKFATPEMMDEFHKNKASKVQKTVIASGPKMREDSDMVGGKPNKTVEQHDINLVPIKAPDYVKHGCFDVVFKVISQNCFAPIWVTGLSGNGKTFGVSQACAVANRELIQVNVSNETSEEDFIGSYVLAETTTYEVEVSAEDYAAYMAYIGS